MTADTARQIADFVRRQRSGERGSGVTADTARQAGESPFVRVLSANPSKTAAVRLKWRKRRR